MTFTCHPATLEEEFCNGVCLITDWGDSPILVGRIVRAPVIQHNERKSAKNWDLAEALQQTKIPRYAKVMANYCKVNCH